jgi:hypothetical protein
MDPRIREVRIHARVSTYQASDAERLVDGFRSVTDALARIRGPYVSLHLGLARVSLCGRAEGGT